MESLGLTVTPNIGYLNTIFSISTTASDISFEVIRNSEIVYSIKSELGFLALEELKESGDYKVLASKNGVIETAHFEVKNALRFGDSELKKSYLFDGIDYLILCFKDRTLFKNERHTITQNRVSPTNIYKIDNQHILFETLRKSGKASSSSYGVYSTEKHRLVSEIMDLNPVYVDVKQGELWFHDSKDNTIRGFDLIGEEPFLQSKVELNNVIEVYFSEYSSLFICKTPDNIISVNLKGKILYKEDELEGLAVDKNGLRFWINDGCTTIKTPENEKISISEDLYLTDLFYQGIEFVNKDYGDDLLRKITAKKISNKDKDELIQFENQIYKDGYDLFAHHDNNLYHFKSSTEAELVKVQYYSKRDFFRPTFKNSKSINLISTFNLATGVRVETIWGGGKIRCLYKSKNSILRFEIVSANGQIVLCMIKGNRIDSQPLDYNVIKNGPRSFLVTKELSELCITDMDQDIKLLDLDHVIAYKVEDNRFVVFVDFHKNRKAFDLLTRTTHSEFEESHPRLGRLAQKRDLNRIKDVPGVIEAFDESLNRFLVRRSNQFVMYHRNSKNELEETSMSFGLTNFSQAYLDPKGHKVLLKNNEGKYILFDLIKNEESIFELGKAIGFNSKGDILVEEDKTRIAKVYDSETLELINSDQYHFYRFLSPDQKLYASVASGKRYFDLIKRIEITKESYDRYLRVFEFTQVIMKLNFTHQDYQNWIHDTLTIFREYLNVSPIDGVESVEHLRQNSFFYNEYFEEKSFIKVGFVDNTYETELELPPLSYFNYASFSYDNKYLSIVGKPQDKGLIMVTPIQIIEDDNSRKVLILSKESSFISYKPLNACWTSEFSRKGVFATYDSNPHTYLLDTSSISSDMDLVSKNKSIETIESKSFLTFSNSGDKMALSEQGYSPMSLGGSGHQESSVVDIVEIDSREVVMSIYDHGDTIISGKSSVKMCAFSEDDSKILTISKDGVVLVTNIENKVRLLENSLRGKEKTALV